MLPQQKNFRCLGARPKYNFANASRTHLRSNGELGKHYSQRQKRFQKVSQSVVFVGLKFSKRTLIVRRTGFSLLCFSPDRAQKSALFARRQATHKKLCWRFFIYRQSLRDKHDVLSFACLPACWCTCTYVSDEDKIRNQIA